MKDRFSEISDNIKRIRDEITDTANSCGRDPSGIELIAVSKTMPSSDIELALRAGQISFGENRPQELVRKIGEISEKNIHWNLIGQLQKNKVKYIIMKDILIHSLCTESTLLELERLGRINDTVTDCLLEVNTSGEASKSGISENEIEEFLGKIESCGHVRLLGMMTIAPYDTKDDEARPYFDRLRRMSERYRSFFKADRPELSMGMSGDFRAAIKEGATMVRIGTSIFGKRQ